MLTVEKFQRLKKAVAESQRDNDRIVGAIEENKKRLKSHGCKTIKEAKQKLKLLDKEIEQLEKKFNKELKVFETEIENHE